MNWDMYLMLFLLAATNWGLGYRAGRRSGLQAGGVVTGEDAERLEQAMENPKPVSREDYESAMESYRKFKPTESAQPRKWGADV